MAPTSVERLDPCGLKTLFQWLKRSNIDDAEIGYTPQGTLVGAIRIHIINFVIINKLWGLYNPFVAVDSGNARSTVDTCQSPCEIRVVAKTICKEKH